MLSFISNDVSFQVRAAAVLVHDHHILLHRTFGDDFWTLPGGRVEAGEDAKSAVKREFIEELGESIECDCLLYLAENFFQHNDAQFHEIAFYFLATLKPESTLGDKSSFFPGIEPEKRLQFAWFPLKAIESMKIYPEFLRQGIPDENAGIIHIVERGD